MSILLVDDNKQMLETMKDILEVYGFNGDIVCCNNGLEAVLQYKKNPTEVIIMDLNMPEYDGIYGIEHILKINPNAKILILTGYPDEHLMNKIKEKHNIEILTKPYPVDRLIQKINSIL